MASIEQKVQLNKTKRLDSVPSGTTLERASSTPERSKSSVVAVKARDPSQQGKHRHLSDVMRRSLGALDELT